MEGIRRKNPASFFWPSVCVFRGVSLFKDSFRFTRTIKQMECLFFVFSPVAKVCWVYLEHHEQLSRPTSDRVRCATTLGHNGFFSCWMSELELVLS